MSNFWPGETIAKNRLGTKFELTNPQTSTELVRLELQSGLSNVDEIGQKGVFAQRRQDKNDLKKRCVVFSA
jgi:hypothetical protein